MGICFAYYGKVFIYLQPYKKTSSYYPAKDQHPCLDRKDIENSFVAV